MGKLKIIFYILFFASALPIKCYGKETYFDVPEQYNYEYISEQVDLNTFLNTIFDLFNKYFNNCTSMFCVVLISIILLSVLTSLNFKSKSELNHVITAVVGSTIFSYCFYVLKTNIELVLDTIEKAKVFSLSSVPVITAMSISAGETLSATLFSTAISICSSIFQIISKNVIVPLVVIYSLLGLSGIITTDFNVYTLCDLIKKIFKWLITSFFGIFTFSFSMQSLLAKSSDNLTKKSIKIAVGKMVPIIGSTLSGSVETLFALASVTKTSYAIFGSVSILSMMLPAILGNALYGAALTVCKYISSFLKLDRLEKAISIVSDIFFMLSAISGACTFMLLCTFLLLILNIG